MSTIVLSGLTDAQVRRIRSALHGMPGAAITVSEAPSGDGLAAALAEGSPDVVALGPLADGTGPFSLARDLIDLDPTIGILVVAPPSERMMVDALEAGARAVLAPEGGAAETRKAFERVLDRTLRLRSRLSGPDGSTPPRTIAVISAKGGAGKTVIAVNLAAEISTGHRRQTAIVDLDLQFGDVATALLLTPDHTVLDAADAAEVTTAGTTALKVFLTRHSPTDLYALCGPEDPGAGERVTPAIVARIIEALSREFRYQVIDTAAGLGEHALVALDHASDIVIVVDLDVPSVRGGRKLIEALDLVGLSGPRRHLVLNRADSKVGLAIDEVTSALGTRIDVALPSSRAVPLSYNEGTPIVLARPRHEFSRGIKSLASRVTAPVPIQQVRRP